jgi:ribosomal protein S18 acetylase RimI-like enzyme
MGKPAQGFSPWKKKTPPAASCSFLDQKDATRAELVSMWAAPSRRQRGVGHLLVDSGSNWAKGRNARILLLMVTGNNESAIRFYERLGFTRTGRTEPYPNDPTVIQFEMSRPIT